VPQPFGRAASISFRISSAQLLVVPKAFAFSSSCSATHLATESNSARSSSDILKLPPLGRLATVCYLALVAQHHHGRRAWQESGHYPTNSLPRCTLCARTHSAAMSSLRSRLGFGRITLSSALLVVRLWPRMTMKFFDCALSRSRTSATASASCGERTPRKANNSPRMLRNAARRVHHHRAVHPGLPGSNQAGCCCDFTMFRASAYGS